MRKITLILLMLVSGLSFGQLFTIETCLTVDSSTYGPMNSVATANATNRTAVIYPGSQLAGISEQVLTAIYFRRAGTSQMSGSPSFRVYLKEVSNTDWGSSAIDWASETTGATLVYNGDPSVHVGNSEGMKAFPLSVPFTYSGQNNLAVFMEYTNPQASSTINWAYEFTAPCINESNNNTTKYANNTSGTLPATLGTSNFRRPIIGFDFEVSCPGPTAFTSEATATSVTLNWTAGGTETNWEYAVLPAADPTPASGTAITSSEVTVAIAPSTSYKAYVRALCGDVDGNSIWSVISFTSPCAPIATLPWFEGFEGLTTLGTTSFPACWTKENGDWSTSNATTYNTPHTGTNYLRDYYNASNEYMWTPGFELEAGVSYDFATFVQGDNHTGWVVDMVYNTQPVSAGATQLGASYNIPGTGTTAIVPYTEMRRSFVPDVSGVYYFAMRVNSPNLSAWYVAFDDFSFDLTPACDAPTAVQIANITSSTAEISWAGLEGVSYNIQYGIGNYEIGEGTVLNDVANPFELEALNSSTNYVVYIQAVCAAGLGSWSGPYTFTTACAPVTTLPWNEGFEGLTTTGSNAFPLCWTKENGDWSTSNATTYNTPHTGTNYLRDYYNASNEYMWTPGFELEAGVSYDFSAYVQGDNHTGWVVDMFVSNQPDSEGASQLGASYNVPGTGSTAISAYEEMRRAFVPATSGVYYFAVRVNSPNLSAWYLAFDDFALEVSPNCPAPESVTFTSVSADSATFVVNADATTLDFDIEYGPQGFSPGEGMLLVGAENPVSIGDLLASSTYDVYVKANCDGDQSTWKGPYSFTTPCTSFGVPTTPEGFEVTGLLPDCWSRSVESGANQWEVSTPTGFGDIPTAHAGTRIISKGYNTSDALLYTPALDYSAVDQPTRINVWLYRKPAASETDKYRFYVNTQASLTGATQIAEIFLKTTQAPVVSAEGWYNYFIDIPVSMHGASAVYVISRGTTTDGWMSYTLGMDEFKIEWAPELSAPSFESSAFSAYPNPVSDVLRFESTRHVTQVNVFSIVGQLVLSQSSASVQSIDMSGLSAGTYLVRVSDGEVTQTIKVIKK